MKNILFAASECVPFIKTGGLADVVGSLPKYFDKKKYDVRVVLPADSQLCPVVESLDIPVIKMDAMADSSYDKKALAPLTELFRKDKPDLPYKTLYGKRQRKHNEKTGKTDGEPSLQ